MRISERDHPFYRPLWRRIAIVAVVAAWAAYEALVAREGFWTVISLGFLGYAVWTFLIDWPRDRGGSAPEDRPPT